MYSLMIVDDEERIRNGLKKFINWSELGFELVVDFDDGKEAIAYLNEHPIDVVLTDIKMAQVSGLELARYIAQHKPETKVVIISGHKEFEYAKKAIEYKVEHYLIKPTNLEETKAVFTNLKAELDAIKESNLESRKEKERYKELLPLLKEQYYTDLFMGVFERNEQLAYRATKIGIEINHQATKCCLVSLQLESLNEYLVDQWEYGKESFYDGLRELIAGIQGIECYIVFHKLNEVKLLAVSSKFELEQDFKEALDQVMQFLQMTIQHTFGLQSNMQHGPIYADLISFSSSGKPFAILEGSINTDKLDTIVEVESFAIIQETYKLMIAKMSSDDEQEVNQLFMHLMGRIKHFPFEIVQWFITDLFRVISTHYKEIGMDLNKITAGKFDLDFISNVKDIDELVLACKAVFRETAANLRDRKENTSSLILKRALLFIEQNYSKDISLEDVANEVFVSSVYFSRFFKQQTGVNFTEYLSKLRLDKAVELLKERKLKIYEISERVGYRSSKYFNRQFKQIMGYTPKEYCRIILKVSDPLDE